MKNKNNKSNKSKNRKSIITAQKKSQVQCKEEKSKQEVEPPADSPKAQAGCSKGIVEKSDIEIPGQNMGENKVVLQQEPSSLPRSTIMTSGLSVGQCGTPNSDSQEANSVKISTISLGNQTLCEPKRSLLNLDLISKQNVLDKSPVRPSTPTHSNALSKSPIRSSTPTYSNVLTKSPVRQSTPITTSRSGTPLVLTPGTPGKAIVRSHSNRGNVKVVVRVRPLVDREVRGGKKDSIVCVDSTEQSVEITKPIEAGGSSAKPIIMTKKVGPKKFLFDHALCSLESSSPNYADQQRVYSAIGKEFLDHNIEGYHTCIFAYGQTGSGKSYTMMGTPQEPGIIPRTCQDLFDKINELSTGTYSFAVRISYFEIYNEQVRDLLNNRSNVLAKLRVRESPTDGPYVENLTEYTVKDVAQVMKYLQEGNKVRTTAATKMNDQSSRSHAVFTLMVKQTIYDTENESTEERTSRIRLVDLAGSERADATGATGERLREGGNINKSLSTLGRVIAVLSSGSTKSMIPYRDSILTWLLKDSLGGNSKTAMVACISPTDYEESLSTLRYANQAKMITTKAVINQDIISSETRDRLVEEMQQQINDLQLSLQDYSNHQAESDKFLSEFTKIKSAIRFYEDRAVLEENKRIAIQQENAALQRHNNLLRGHLKEVTNQNVGVYSTQQPIISNYEHLKQEHQLILEDLGNFKCTIASCKENYSQWLTQ